jgi:hypothetical protein
MSSIALEVWVAILKQPALPGEQTNKKIKNIIKKSQLNQK